jgi:hypothetical protein
MTPKFKNKTKGKGNGNGNRRFLRCAVSHASQLRSE